MGRLIYSLQKNNLSAPLSPESLSSKLQKAANIRGALLTVLGMRQSVCWLSTLAAGWNVHIPLLFSTQLLMVLVGKCILVPAHEPCCDCLHSCSSLCQLSGTGFICNKCGKRASL